MTDEKEPAEDTGAAVAEEPEVEAGAEAQAEEKKEEKLNQSVELIDTGPCKKHIKVTIPRADLDKKFEEKYKDLVDDSQVPGFRPGKAPKQIVIRKFKKEVTEQIRAQVLMASLEQLAEDFDVAPLSPPDINPNKLEIPEKGDFIYEFDVEVRPQFDLPEYKGLKLKRPVKTFTDDDVVKEEHRILSRYGQLVPKPEGNAQIGDFLIVDMTTKYAGQVIGKLKETTIRIDDTVTFKDAVAPKFGEQTVGANAGDTKTVNITMTQATAQEMLRGQNVDAILEIKDVKKLRLPELTEDFLSNLGVRTPEQLRESVRVVLDRRLEYQQRQSIREQVLLHIAASSQWELPQDLLMRQARKTLARRVMEMREAGLGEDEIKARQRLLERDVLQSTELGLKEHFVLQKLAEVEKIEVGDDDVADEIERMADQSGESPRRVRAQLEKDDLLDTLAAQIIERKALDLILDNAEYEDVPLDKEPGLAVVEQQTVEGELQDPTQAPPEEKPAEEKSE
ncbi:MAG: trigger factor [Gemmataceae bacterium]|nr:trigger factor [Gemmataceae bacterium]MCI0740296.1 trigger factor [Gemmataceae bacterium]